MKTISTIDMPKSEWLRHRQSFIGGSESAAVFGLNEYMSPVDVYLSKIAAEPIDIPVNDIMQSGNDAELFMPQWYADQTGFQVVRDFHIRIHDEIDYIGVNLDGIISDPNHETPGVLEIKTTNPEEVERWNNKLPYRHALQVHHGMLVTGWTWGVVIVLIRDKYAWQKLAFPVDYSKQVQKLQLEAYSEFWNNHVLKRIPPDPVNLDDIKSLFPQSEPEKFIIADDSDYDKVVRIKAFQGDTKVLNDEINKLKFEIQAKMGDAELLKYNDKILATFRTGSDKEIFDDKQFASENPELYNKYLKSKQGNRTFLPKKIK